MDIPADRRYSPEHTWAQSDGEATTVGITDHAQDELGDIVYLDLPEPGKRVEQGARMGEIESVKSVSELIAPISGEVLERNTAAIDKPDLVNTNPYGEGWLVKMRASDTDAIGGLLSASEYQALVESED